MTRCRHNRSWLIASGSYEWCAQCGALRPLVQTGVASCALHPEKSWAHTSALKPPTSFGRRAKRRK